MDITFQPISTYFMLVLLNNYHVSKINIFTNCITFTVFFYTYKSAYLSYMVFRYGNHSISVVKQVLFQIITVRNNKRV